MKFKIKNLGAISEAEVDLTKNINIFCGQNSTGKTYLAYIIYGLIKQQFFFQAPNPTMSAELTSAKLANYEIKKERVFEFRNDLIQHLYKNLHLVFGISEDTCKKLFNKFEIEYIEDNETFYKSFFQNPFNLSINLFKKKFEFDKEANTDVFQIKLHDDALLEFEEVTFIERNLPSLLYNAIVKFPVLSAHILPVERNSIYSFKDQLSNVKQDSYDYLQKVASRKSKDRKDIFSAFIDSAIGNYRYPKAIRDGIEDAENISVLKKKKGHYYDVATEIEEALLKGTINIDNEDGINFKYGTVSLPIQTSSSLIKALSSIIIYLKHIAKPGDLLLIDEPEVNLHPNIQILFIRLLVRLSNMGLKLLISTHSDYIIRELNNMVMYTTLRRRNIEIPKFLIYNEDNKIDISELKISYFQFKKSTSKKVKVTEVLCDEYGFSINSIDDAINTQNEVSELLYFTIRDFANERN